MTESQVEREELGESFVWGRAAAGYRLVSPNPDVGRRRWGKAHSPEPVKHSWGRGARLETVTTHWPPWLVEAEGNACGPSFHPLLEYPELYREFAELPLTAREVLRFAARYGLLGCNGMILFAPERRGLPHLVTGESFWNWCGEIQTIRSAVQLVDALRAAERQEDPGDLADLIVWHRGNAYYQPRASERKRVLTLLRKADRNSMRETLERDWEIQLKPRRISLTSRWEPKLAEWRRTRDVMGPAARFASALINKNIRGRVSPQLELAAGQSKGASFRTVTSPSCLLGAMWLQLYEEFTGKRRMQKCLLCGKRFDAAEHPRQSYCRRRGASCRKKADRIRKDVCEGMPPAQAAERHGVPLERVLTLSERIRTRAAPHGDGGRPPEHRSADPGERSSSGSG